jgi:hypothetical protein
MAASDEPGAPLGLQLPLEMNKPPSLPTQVLSVASAEAVNKMSVASAAMPRQGMRLKFIGRLAVRATQALVIVGCHNSLLDGDLQTAILTGHAGERQ